MRCTVRQPLPRIAGPGARLSMQSAWRGRIAAFEPICGRDGMDRYTWYIVAGLIVVVLLIAYAAGWLGGAP
jgi:hypothetical protein